MPFASVALVLESESDAMVLRRLFESLAQLRAKRHLQSKADRLHAWGMALAGLGVLGAILHFAGLVAGIQWVSPVFIVLAVILAASSLCFLCSGVLSGTDFATDWIRVTTWHQRLALVVANLLRAFLGIAVTGTLFWLAFIFLCVGVLGKF